MNVAYEAQTPGRAFSKSHDHPCNTTPVQKELKMYNPSIIKVKNQNSYIIVIITHNYLPNQDVSYGDLVMNVKPRGSLC